MCAHSVVVCTKGVCVCQIKMTYMIQAVEACNLALLIRERKALLVHTITSCNNVEQLIETKKKKQKKNKRETNKARHKTKQINKRHLVQK